MYEGRRSFFRSLWWRSRRPSGWGGWLGFAISSAVLFLIYCRRHSYQGGDEPQLSKELRPGDWQDERGDAFYLSGWPSDDRILFCLETTDGRHSRVITQRLKAIEGELSRLGMNQQKMVLVTPRPQVDTVEKRMAWLKFNALNLDRWSFIASDPPTLVKAFQYWQMKPTTRGDVRLAMTNGRGDLIYVGDLSDGSPQAVASKIAAASASAFKSTGSLFLPSPAQDYAYDPYYDYVLAGNYFDTFDFDDYYD